MESFTKSSQDERETSPEISRNRKVIVTSDGKKPVFVKNPTVDQLNDFQFKSKKQFVPNNKKTQSLSKSTTVETLSITPTPAGKGQLLKRNVSEIPNQSRQRNTNDSQFTFPLDPSPNVTLQERAVVKSLTETFENVPQLPPVTLELDPPAPLPRAASQTILGGSSNLFTSVDIEIPQIADPRPHLPINRYTNYASTPKSGSTVFHSLSPMSSGNNVISGRKDNSLQSKHPDARKDVDLVEMASPSRINLQEPINQGDPLTVTEEKKMTSLNLSMIPHSLDNLPELQRISVDDINVSLAKYSNTHVSPQQSVLPSPETVRVLGTQPEEKKDEVSINALISPAKEPAASPDQSDFQEDEDTHTMEEIPITNNNRFHFEHVASDSDGRSEDMIFRSSSFAQRLYKPAAIFEQFSATEQWHPWNQEVRVPTTFDEVKEFEKWLLDLQGHEVSNTIIQNINCVLLRLLEETPEGTRVLFTWINNQEDIYRADLLAYVEYVRSTPLEPFDINAVRNLSLSQLVNTEGLQPLKLLRVSIAQQKLALFLLRMSQKQLAFAKSENQVQFGDWNTRSRSISANIEVQPTSKEEWFWPLKNAQVQTSVEEQILPNAEDQKVLDTHRSPHLKILQNSFNLTSHQLRETRAKFLADHSPVWSTTTNRYLCPNVSTTSHLPIFAGPIYTQVGASCPLDIKHIHCFDLFNEFNNLGESVYMIDAHNRGAITFIPGKFQTYVPVGKVSLKYPTNEQEGLDIQDLLNQGYVIMMQRMEIDFKISSKITNTSIRRPLSQRQPRAHIAIFQTEDPSLKPVSLIMQSEVKEFPSLPILSSALVEPHKSPFSLTTNIDWMGKCLESTQFEQGFASSLLNEECFFFPTAQLSLENFTSDDDWQLSWSWSAIVGSPFLLAMFLLSQKALSLTTERLSQHISTLSDFAENNDQLAKDLLQKYVFHLE